MFLLSTIFPPPATTLCPCCHHISTSATMMLTYDSMRAQKFSKYKNFASYHEELCIVGDLSMWITSWFLGPIYSCYYKLGHSTANSYCIDHFKWHHWPVSWQYFKCWWTIYFCIEVQLWLMEFSLSYLTEIALFSNYLNDLAFISG